MAHAFCPRRTGDWAVLMPVLDRRIDLAPCLTADIARLEAELGVSNVVAQVLARRGFADPTEARAWREAGVRHDHAEFCGLDAALAVIRRHVEAGSRITVHGDYDVDGVCSTAILVRALRSIGGDVDWYLPSRLEDGYGLSARTVERLAAKGTRLLVTADCAITAVEEVAAARAAGMDVVVTDHHTPRADGTLPDAPIVHPAVCGYPCAHLCAAGVALKVAEALGAPTAAEDLDLAALATVADVVPLVDENRALAAAGLRALARTSRPGLQELMRSAHVDPATVDAGAVGFRLAPRINAAGRLGHPGAALRLLLTEDAEEAARLAGELETLNRDRQAVEERILREALRQVAGWPEAARRRRAYVLWGEEWHQGVIGIVASRLVERFGRPVVLIAGGEDAWKGSGRSIPAFDLHAALGACSAELERFGGHRAAAGLSILPDRVEAFAQAFAEHADGVPTDTELRPVLEVDAIVRGDELTLGLVEELERLAPFGLGNPGVTLLAPACELTELGAVGDGKHLKLAVTPRAVQGRPVRSGAIAFGQGAQLDRFRRPGLDDVAFRLAANRWNGTVSPQLVVRRVFDAVDGFDELREWLAAQWRAGEQAWTPEARAIFTELELAAGARRSLLESATFRMLLEEKPVLAAAA